MAEPSKPLMLSWRFAPLFWCQFFSAFNDNFLKNAIVFLILFHMGSQGEALITLAGAVFIAPYFFLSALGGQVADRFDKAVVAQRLKLVEIGVAAIAVIGFVVHAGEDPGQPPVASLTILFVALFGFGVIGSLFGPIKYGILPDHLERRELPAGNALVEGATFIAILLGTIVGGIAAKGGGSPAAFSVLVMVFALLCWVSALLIPRTGEGAPNLIINWNIASSTWELIRDLRSDERLWWGALVTSWFWLAGVVVLSLLPPAVKNIVGGDEYAVTAFLAVFSIAVAVGSGLAAFLASGRIILLPTLLGAVFLAAFALFMGWSLYGAPPPAQLMGPFEVFGTSRGINVAIALTGLAIGGGLFIVPAFAAVQAWAGADRRARVVAAVNILNALFMTVATLVVAMLQGFAGATTPTLFIGLGVANLIVAGLIAFTMPTRPFADALSIIYRAFFRAEVHGLENLQKVKQPNVILALNHVSFLDAGIALSLLGRDPLFAIDTTMAQKWWVKPFARMTRSLPIDPLKPMATRTLIHAVASGETLIIFPEGRLTMTGSLMKVYDGAGLIADKSDAVIVPIRIEGLERSYLTRLKGYQIRKQLFPKVRVTVLEPTKLNLDPALRGKARRRAAGAALYDVMSNMIYETTPTDRTIVQALIEAAHEHGMKTVATEDLVTGTLTYKRLLLGTRILGKKLMPLAAEGKPLGVMLPNANGAVVTIFGLMSAGRVPAMINFTAGATNILAGCRAAGIDTVVTSRAFIERGKLEPLVEKMSAEVKFVYLEDVRATVGTFDKIAGMLSYKKPLVARNPDDWAAILFTSGSEGVPKGVVLSYRNILTNAAQARARIDFNRMDKVFNILPVFHSFGLTVGVILPIVSGVPIFLYPSPLHYRTVPELVYVTNATIMFGTDTFLNGYARAANPYDFRSIRYLLAGAEPVRDATRQTYLEKFGLRILEGYGVTETAPALALNTPMFNKFGTVGRLLPGMEARLQKVEGVDEGGRLFVKGPNVMLGYLRVENPGVLERPSEGWHDTGDIVTIDAQGFIKIMGRAKRFAKVGGEMVSFAAVEALAGNLWPEATLAVVSVPDARKGERLLLYINDKDATRSDFIAFARARHASELMIPGEVIFMEKLPMLGSGKVDLLTLSKQAKEERAQAAAAKPAVPA
ncbi:acyl-[ACP]--phospholipid O-acyltransferase [Pseudorhodoplanes sp.]|uniref:acyl-[ACP]--phospholipid O-acyltransferase n=1 Tax=Pseudorhodoplanes sp. TaxID=1934341 RepID=UPI003D1230EA